MPYINGKEVWFSNAKMQGKNLALAKDVYKGAGHYAVLELDGRQCVRFVDNTNISYIIEGGFKENTQYTVSFDCKTVNHPSFVNGKYMVYSFIFKYTDNTSTFLKITGEVDWSNAKLTSTAGKTVKSVGLTTHEYRCYIYIDINTFILQEGAVDNPEYEPKFTPCDYITLLK